MERESFVFHRSYIKDVPREMMAYFCLTICAYGTDGVEPDFSDKPEAERWLWVKIWNSIRERIDADFESYISTSEKRKLSFAVTHFKNGRANEAEITLLREHNFDFQKCAFRGYADNAHKTESMNIDEHKNDVYAHKSATDTDTRRDTEFESDTDTEFDSLSVSDTEFESECVSVSEEKTHTPTLDEVSEYVESNDLGIDAERFFDTYDKDGWRINGKPFDWKKRADWWARTQTVKVKPSNGGEIPNQWALTAENARKRRARKNE